MSPLIRLRDIGRLHIKPAYVARIQVRADSVMKGVVHLGFSYSIQAISTGNENTEYVIRNNIAVMTSACIPVPYGYVCNTRQRHTNNRS